MMLSWTAYCLLVGAAGMLSVIAVGALMVLNVWAE